MTTVCAFSLILMTSLTFFDYQALIEILSEPYYICLISNP